MTPLQQVLSVDLPNIVQMLLNVNGTNNLILITDNFTHQTGWDWARSKQNQARHFLQQHNAPTAFDKWTKIQNKWAEVQIRIEEHQLSRACNDFLRFKRDESNAFDWTKLTHRIITNTLVPEFYVFLQMPQYQVSLQKRFSLAQLALHRYQTPYDILTDYLRKHPLPQQQVALALAQHDPAKEAANILRYVLGKSVLTARDQALTRQLSRAFAAPPAPPAPRPKRNKKLAPATLRL